MKTETLCRIIAIAGLVVAAGLVVVSVVFG